MKKICIILGVFGTCATIALFAAYLIFKGSEYTVIIEKEKIQEAINKKMPFEKTFYLVLKLTINETQIQLNEGSERLTISTAIDLAVNVGKKEKHFSGQVTASSELHYEPSHHQFYLQNPIIENIHIKGVPDKYSKIVSSTAKEGNVINSV
ncbi:MAG: DUF1439 domain-containing protein [Planctomycetes bacterium]|nr:DUF1439 domain-containing protein [Planctomycetota bacterium]